MPHYLFLLFLSRSSYLAPLLVLFINMSDVLVLRLLPQIISEGFGCSWTVKKTISNG